MNPFIIPILATSGYLLFSSFKKVKAGTDLTFELDAVQWQGISDGSLRVGLTFNLYNKSKTSVNVGDFDLEVKAFDIEKDDKGKEIRTNEVRLGRLVNTGNIKMKGKTNNKLPVNASFDIKRLLLNYAFEVYQWIRQGRKPQFIEAKGSFKLDGVTIPYTETYEL